MQLRPFLFSLSLQISACAAAHTEPTTAPAPAISQAPEGQDDGAESAARLSEPAEPVPETQAEPSEAPEPAEPPPAATAEEPSGPKASRPPRDILTTADIAFMISYGNSAPKAAAEKECSQEGEDPALVAECLRTAREKFQADVLRFKKEGGNWWWTTYKRQGKDLLEIHKVRIEFGEENEAGVILKLKAPDKGKRQLFKTRNQMLIEVPNDYSIVIDDPELGRLVYDAKIGLVDR